MADRNVGPVESTAAAAAVLRGLEEAASVLAGFEHLVRSGALTAVRLRLRTAEDEAAARLLAAVGLVTVVGDEPPQLAPGFLDLLADRGTSLDEAALVAQDQSSAEGGRMLALSAIPALAGLSDRFAGGGVFLDIGVGAAEMAIAFCDAVPNARVVGIDVVPGALARARQTIGARGLQDRVEVRLQPVHELFDIGRFDLAWMPAPSLPARAFHDGLRPVYDALRPGGWLIVAAGRAEGDDLAVAVTRWRTVRGGGTPLTADEARAALDGAGFVDQVDLPSPPAALALYAGRHPVARPPPRPARPAFPASIAW